MSEPLAYFLTWRCYGSWHHGDERGSVDMTETRYRAPILEPDPERRRRAIRRQRDPTFCMDPRHRAAVEATIREVAAFRAWILHALNVRTTHAHAVLRAPGFPPEPVLAQLKAWCTRRLREAGLVGSEHGSTRYLWDQDSPGRAIRHALECQGEPLA